jgi:hypothetical protein
VIIIVLERSCSFETLYIMMHVDPIRLNTAAFLEFFPALASFPDGLGIVKPRLSRGYIGPLELLASPTQLQGVGARIGSNGSMRPHARHHNGERIVVADPPPVRGIFLDAEGLTQLYYEGLGLPDLLHEEEIKAIIGFLVKGNVVCGSSWEAESLVFDNIIYYREADISRACYNRSQKHTTHRDFIVKTGFMRQGPAGKAKAEQCCLVSSSGLKLSPEEVVI